MIDDEYYSTSKPIKTSSMVVMDVENIRGASSFRISHEALISRIRLWREDRLSMAVSSAKAGHAVLEPLAWICDHGTASTIHHFSLFGNGDGDGKNDDVVHMPHNFGVMFAGPDRTADDVIVDLVELRSTGREGISNYDHEQTRNSTIVITADSRLITRCQQARRKSNSVSDVIFVEPASLLQQLERYRINSNQEESVFGEKHYLSSPPLKSKSQQYDKRMDGKTTTVTSFKDSTIAMEQHAKFQQRFQNKKDGPLSDAIQEKEEPRIDDDDDNNNKMEDQSSDTDSAALAAQLKTEQIRRQFLLSDAYYLARPSKNIRGRKSAAVHAQYKNRNISNKQQKKLYNKRFGNKRKDNMVAAASKRKELAAKLQLNMERINPDCGDEVIEGESGLLIKLLGRFEGERLRMPSLNDMEGRSSESLTSAATSDPSDLLGLVAGRITDDKWDPLGTTLKVPLRGDVEGNDKSLPPLRIVVISDTHGFEGALAKFGGTKRSDDFLLPKADVLIHCGDFAASGSRKTQRMAARRLDEFLSRQTHIPEIIVIKGNHDPDSPSKVLFPSSKALYVRSGPSTLMVNGVSFYLEPFSRRMAFRSIRRRTNTYAMPSLPECDILVSHEPPKGTLDLTYHGFSAGSMYLRELVDHAEYKPRLWLCGHIHESRGMMVKHFCTTQYEEDEEKEDSPTMVINASNANSGRANRLVSGAVVVEIERITSNTGETAEGTLQSRKRDNSDEFLVNGSGDISGLGDEFELYQLRPGVRRRKGVPLSARQQMKRARTALISASEIKSGASPHT